jgi:thioredoxin-like negative regulator of GroEL
MGSVLVTYLSPWDNKCKTIKSEILGLSRNFPTLKFYQVDVTKHAMLRSVFTDDELPTVILVHNGEVFLS